MYLYKKNLPKRIVATLLDYTLFFLVAAIYIMLVGEDTPEGAKNVENLEALPIPFFWFVYFVVVEAQFGATLGHQALNLMVLSRNRNEVSFTQTLKRRLLDLIDFSFMGIPAIVIVSNNDKSQRLGDMVADTIVVDAKDSEQYTPPYKKTI